MKLQLTDQKVHRQKFALDPVIKDLGEGEVEVIVSTNSQDRHEEVVDIAGMDIKQYNGVVLWAHNHFDLPIGKSTKLKKIEDQTKIISTTKFALAEYEFAGTVYRLVKGGFINDVSIGFIAFEFDWETMTWTKSEMIEYSYVNVGANRDAKVTGKALEGLDSMGLNVDSYQEQFKDFLVKATTSKKSEIETRIKTLEDSKDFEQLKGTINSLKTAVSALDAKLSLATEMPATRKRKIFVVQAKKNAQLVDKINEQIISDVKKIHVRWKD